jgi:hypothetical protein
MRRPANQEDLALQGLITATTTRVAVVFFGPLKLKRIQANYYKNLSTPRASFPLLWAAIYRYYS